MPTDLDTLIFNFESTWDGFLKLHYGDGDPLRRAVHYVLSGKGKRLRALLTMMTAESLGAEWQEAIVPAFGCEMVHAYSLVHDDLPCMDNDDMRRGRPTAHKEFGDALALLAGDAILTDSFAVLVGDLEIPGFSLGEQAPLSGWIRELALGCGSHGMVWGQARDIAAVVGAKHATPKEIERTYLTKTGGSIGAACAMGALASGASASTVDIYRRFGREVGLSFQIVDDLIDHMEGTGKSAGKDLRDAKPTYVSVLGEQTALEAASSIQHRALANLKSTANHLDGLEAYLDLLIQRVS